MTTIIVLQDNCFRRLIFSMILGVACGILGFASLGGVLFFVAGMSLLACKRGEGVRKMFTSFTL